MIKETESHEYRITYYNGSSELISATNVQRYNAGGSEISLFGSPPDQRIKFFDEHTLLLDIEVKAMSSIRNITELGELELSLPKSDINVGKSNSTDSYTTSIVNMMKG